MWPWELYIGRHAGHRALKQLLHARAESEPATLPLEACCGVVCWYCCVAEEKLDMLFQELGQWQPDLAEDPKAFKG
eukprot:5735636-Amphidinium_carterae.2